MSAVLFHGSGAKIEDSFSRTLIEITDGLNKNNADRLEEYDE
jgi:hypothetical protein